MAQTYNLERIPGRSIVGSLIVGAFLTALTVESAATVSDRKRLRNKARTVDNVRDGERAIYILPGCRADGHYIGQMLEPHIQHFGTTHHEAYPEEDFSIDAVKESLLEARAKDGDRPATFYALSMGGMVLTKLLLDEEFRTKFGKIDKVIFDSSPSSAADLDRGTRIAMFAASVLPSSWTISRLYRYFMRRGARKMVHHSPLVTDEQARGHALSTANTPLRRVEKEAKFIGGVAFKDGEGLAAAEGIDEMYYLSASSDHVVTNLEGAHDKYNRIFGGKVLRIIDVERPAGSHAHGPEFPEKVVELISYNQPKNDEPDNVIPLFAPSLQVIPLAA